MTAGLQAHVRTSIGRLSLDVPLAVAPGGTVAVVGPNGAGKTTLLRALAGLHPVTGGVVRLDGEVLDDPGSGVAVPPQRRPVGLVFQDLRLFPHLSCVENVAFGLRARGLRARDARVRATAELERLGLAPNAGDRPGVLSGGQAQRVALARALVGEPRLLLLDEPLAALDAGARVDTRRQIAQRLATQAGACVLVTHDPLEAMALAERLVVLEEGRVVQEGTVDELRRAPRSAYVAELLGVNLLPGIGRGDAIELEQGRLVVPGRWEGDVLAVVHPRAVALHRSPPAGSPRNVWSGTVRAMERTGDRIRVEVAGPVPIVAEVTAGAVAALGLAPGEQVWAAVKATEVTVHPA